ncbi:MAG: hypothetical protein Q9P01_10545 [Anaerolineae bacterium]|nr:hypothetical protein [Anaerolineae bacterium]
MRRIALIIGGLVAVCIVFFVVVLGVAWFATSGVATAADDFMTALQNDDMDAAYAMFTTALKDEVSPEQFNEMFANNVFVDDALDSWSFNNRSVENSTGEVSGTATVGDREFSVTLNFVNNDSWKLIGFNFEPRS